MAHLPTQGHDAPTMDSTQRAAGDQSNGPDEPLPSSDHAAVTHSEKAMRWNGAYSTGDTEPPTDPLASGGSTSNADDQQNEKSDEIGTSEYSDDSSSLPPDSPLSYARYYDLCRDYELDSLLESDLVPLPPRDAKHDLLDPPAVISLESLVTSDDLIALNTFTEKWDVDRETTQLIASAAIMPKPLQQPGDWLSTLPTIRPLKIDPAILGVDHEVEMLKLRARNVVKLSTRGMVPFKIREEKGEGIVWTAVELRAKAELDEKLMNERLEVPKATVEYIREVVEVSKAKEHGVEYLLSRKPRESAHVTPPLLPLSPIRDIGHLEADGLELPLTSTPEDLIAEEAAALEHQLMQEEEADFESNVNADHTVQNREGEREYDGNSPHTSVDEPSSSSLLKRKLIRKLKADEPLTPQDATSSSQPPTKRAKTVSFLQEVASLIPQPSEDEPRTNSDEAHAHLNDFLQETAMPLAELVAEELNNEELIEADTILRLLIPRIDSPKPLAPWGVYTGNGQPHGQRQFLQYIGKEVLKGVQKWSGISKLDRMLTWTPFPAWYGKINVDEAFDDGSCERYMTELRGDEEVTLDSLICKMEGLRVLDAQEDDDDEIEEVVVYNSDEDAALEQEQDTAVEPSMEQPVVSTALHTSTQHDAAVQAPSKPDMLTLLRKRQLEFGQEAMSNKKPATASNPFSHLTGNGGISTFMQLNGGAAPEMHAPVSLRPPTKTQEAAPTAVMFRPPTDTTADKISNLPSPDPLPVPTIVSAERKIPALITTALLSQRTLVRLVEKRLPNIELVERESSSGSTTTANKSRIFDADVTVSPSTGIVLTTLQKLKQKPLPGQTSYYGVHERLAAIAPRYERVLLLVSEGAHSTPGDAAIQALDERDCETIANTINFAATLDTDVDVIYVAGGENELADWIAACMSQLSTSDAGYRLLPDETVWERFLRTAGMSPFAAQVVLGSLKLGDEAPQYDSSGGSSFDGVQDRQYGLPAFLAMSLPERIERFAVVLGGSRVLTKVSELIDAKWTALA